MHSLRFITVSALITLPFFVFAQTTATTTAEQPDQTTIDLQNQINQFVNEQTKLIPTVEDVRANAIRDYLEVKTVPQNPGPSETINVSVESYLTDLNKATITWSVNGIVIERGIGRKTFSLQNGSSGKTTRLTISITTNGGEVITKRLSWSPVGVTILWEADTYTPPFYKGKALLTAEAKMRAIAIPDNTAGQNALNAGNLVYVWEKDGTTVSESSGYGKNSFSFTGPRPYERANVKVRASSLNDGQSSETKVDIPLSQPFILFYEKHPLLGVWYNKPFDTDVTLSKKEFSVSAVPYFFSNESSDESTLSHVWSVNGKLIQNYGHTITLRNDTGVKGDSSVSLAVRGLKQTFQSGSKNLRVHFQEDTTSRPTF